MIDIEEVLPKIIDYIKRTRMAHGLEKLSHSLANQKLREQRIAWSHIHDQFSDRQRAHKLLRMVFGRHQSIKEYGSLTRSF
jgi:hypothetical protein